MKLVPSFAESEMLKTFSASAMLKAQELYEKEKQQQHTKDASPAWISHAKLTAELVDQIKNNKSDMKNLSEGLEKKAAPSNTNKNDNSDIKNLVDKLEKSGAPLEFLGPLRKAVENGSNKCLGIALKMAGAIDKLITVAATIAIQNQIDNPKPGTPVDPNALLNSPWFQAQRNIFNGIVMDLNNQFQIEQNAENSNQVVSTSTQEELAENKQHEELNQSTDQQKPNENTPENSGNKSHHSPALEIAEKVEKIDELRLLLKYAPEAAKLAEKGIEDIVEKIGMQMVKG